MKERVSSFERLLKKSLLLYTFREREIYIYVCMTGIVESFHSVSAPVGVAVWLHTSFAMASFVSERQTCEQQEH